MMLRVEGKLAATVSLLHPFRRRRRRSPPQMNDLRLGAEEDRPATRAHGGAEVHVFRIHEEPRVEAAHLVQILDDGSRDKRRLPNPRR